MVVGLVWRALRRHRIKELEREDKKLRRANEDMTHCPPRRLFSAPCHRPILSSDLSLQHPRGDSPKGPS